jgi:hypothetical protein
MAGELLSDVAMQLGRAWRRGVMAIALGVAGGGPAGCGGSSSGSHPGAHVDASVDQKLVINELMALNVLTTKDENGAAAAWIEIYNPTGQDIDLEGYALTDDFNTPQKAVLPKGVSVDAHGTVVLWADQNPGAGPTHVNVFLPAAGGSIGLARADGSFIDRLSYGAQEVDMSAAREPDGSNNWVTEWSVSPGKSNPMGSGQPFGPQPASDPPEMVPAAGDLSDQVLGYDQQPHFDLKISDADIATLKSSPQTWVQATLTYAGRDYGPIGVNLKGTSSFEPIDQKPAFRVNINKFAKGARFFGLKEFLLNNMTQDQSMIHERLAYWLGRQVGGIPTPRCNHSWVTLNGTALGIYATVEEAKTQMMAYSFTDSSGGVFTVNYADFTNAYVANFQYQDGNPDTTLITDTINALTLTPADAAIAAAGNSVNLHQFTRYWALMVATGHWGGWPYAPDPEPAGANVRIYLDPTSKQIYFIPEGINDAFATSDFDFIAHIKSVLAKNCGRAASCYQDFANQLNEILGKAQQLDWVSEAKRVSGQIANMVPMDDKKPYSNDQVSTAQQQVGFFMTDRPTYVSKYLSPP